MDVCSDGPVAALTEANNAKDAKEAKHAQRHAGGGPPMRALLPVLLLPNPAVQSSGGLTPAFLMIESQRLKSSANSFFSSTGV